MMKRKIITSSFFLCMFVTTSLAQEVDSLLNKVKDKAKEKLQISGTMGVTYEGYGLNRSPSGWTGYQPRRPWNQVRFNFTPTFKFSKNFSLPFNFNFAAIPTNFAGPYAGIKKPTFGQFITNPMNSFGINPKYKWAELQLGTQYLKYSELSTGDIGVFGVGVDLRPKIFRFKFFTGISQQGINYVAGPPTVTGAYKRKNWMAQIGLEKEDSYLFAINIAKGKDVPTSAAPPPLTIRPQEGIVISLVSDLYRRKAFILKPKAHNLLFTKDLATPLSSNVKSLKPFIEAHTSTITDFAGQLAVGKKGKNLDLGVMVKYLGAGFQTIGYPFLQSDRLDYLLNTRINAWKNKMNIVASLGQRVNNVKNTALRAKQFIGNLNWFTQFSDNFSLNINYNNFGFQTASGLNPFGIKNVSNDLGINPTFTFTGKKIIHLISMSYNYSKYDERDVYSGLTTSNNTHTGVLTYVPTYLEKEISPDFSILYFYNDVPGAKITLATLSAALSMQAAKKEDAAQGAITVYLGKT
ncbi:MAG: hypothetical protein IPL54_00160 [Chitinophagaceae bacterium]|nr:hypothetical protein [Chitinophagaceae bacterium]